MISEARLLVRRLRRFAALSGYERRLFWRAFFTLGVVDVGLRTGGFRRLVEEADAGCASPRPAIEPCDLDRARHYARWIDVASRFHVVPAHCLHRSLALHRWLLSEGLRSELRIGVRKDDGGLRAHAWVELGDTVINDRPHVPATFTPLVQAGGRSPTWARPDRAFGRGRTTGSGGRAVTWR